MNAILTYIYDFRAIVVYLVGIVSGLMIARWMAKQDEKARAEIDREWENYSIDFNPFFKKWGNDK